MYLNIVAIIIVIKVLTDKTDKVRGSDSCNCPSDSSQCQDIVGDLNDQLYIVDPHLLEPGPSTD